MIKTWALMADLCLRPDRHLLGVPARAILSASLCFHSVKQAGKGVSACGAGGRIH